MNPLAFTPKFWLEVAIMAALAGVVWWGYNHVKGIGYAESEAKHAAEDKARAEATLQEVLKAAKDTQALQAGANQIQGEVNAKLLASGARTNALVISLSNRPDRPSPGSVSTSTPAGTSTFGTTGAGLYRADGQFLIGESAGANELQTRLKACYAAYSAIEAKLNK